MIEAGDTFRWGDKDLEYLVHPYNTTALNERAVEVPIALDWISHQKGVGLEVGNVLSHYVSVQHRVVDLFEVAPGVDNLDVREVQGSYDWILAISTLEHVDQEKLGLGPYDALQHLHGLLNPGGEMLITVPFGQQPYLDVCILDSMCAATWQCTLVRHWETGLWTRQEKVVWAPAREMGWPSTVWVATWTKET